MIPSWQRFWCKGSFMLRWLLRTPKAPSDEGVVAKRLRERTCSVFSRIYQECESFQAFSPPVSVADSPLVRGGRWAAKRSFCFPDIRKSPPKHGHVLWGGEQVNRDALFRGYRGRCSGPCGCLRRRSWRSSLRDIRRCRRCGFRSGRWWQSRR